MIQLQFLNKVLQCHDASLLVTNNLTQEYFSDYQEEFNFIQQHLRKYGTVPDEVTFLTKFPEFDIIKVEESDSYLIDALFEDRNKRMLARVFNKVRELLNVGKVEEAMNTYMAASSDVVKATHLEAVDIILFLKPFSIIEVGSGVLSIVLYLNNCSPFILTVFEILFFFYQ